MKSFKILSLFLLLIVGACALNPKGHYYDRTVANSAIERTYTAKTSIEQVHSGSRAEEVVRIKNAEIVLVDYDLVRKDFPSMVNKSNDEIDRWILDQVAYISRPQAAQSIVNTPIETADEVRQAWRPPEYGRALVYDMINPDSGEKVGLMDAKGVGSLNPGQRDHGNGIATLGEAIREYLYEGMMRNVLNDADVPNQIVGSYAVIDAGFDLKHADGSTSPAGFYLRQAHDRVTNPGAWLDEVQRLKLQKIFHKYGIDPNRNIQGTKNGAIFDFGHYIVRDDLGSIDPAKQVPFDRWGYDKSIRPDGRDTRWFYSKVDHPWNWSHELADNFRRGRADRDAAWQHFVNLVDPVREKLTRDPGNGCVDNVTSIIGH
jgi:hypothetical protein